MIKIIIVALAVSLLISLLRTFLGDRNMFRNITGKKKSSNFISEELYKLHELRKRGILTEEEYQKQKNKLLE